MQIESRRSEWAAFLCKSWHRFPAKGLFDRPLVETPAKGFFHGSLAEAPATGLLRQVLWIKSLASCPLPKASSTGPWPRPLPKVSCITPLAEAPVIRPLLSGPWYQLPGIRFLASGAAWFSGSSQAQQTLQLQQGLLQITIDQHRIKFRRRRQFLPSPLKAAGDRRLAVGAPAANPPFQLLKAGRCQKNLQGGREALPHLPGPCQLDFQQHRPLLEVASHRLPRCAIEVAGEFGPLQKVAGSDALLEVWAAEEEIIAALLFPLPG